uniref:Uncharacterized protein n=1 Tax=Arundo donax TaxID=35708 RepID=A0A0A9AC88_ARUDO
MITLLFCRTASTELLHWKAWVRGS